MRPSKIKTLLVDLVTHVAVAILAGLLVTKSFERDLVRQGVAEYNQTTGHWQLKPPPPSLAESLGLPDLGKMLDEDRARREAAGEFTLPQK